jgi:hypothetical protein
MPADPPENPEKPERRRGGRKKKTTSRQEHVVSVRLTDAEYAELAREAAEVGKYHGELLRAVWLGTPYEPLARTPRTAEEKEERRQLIGMAGNLNQMTKQLHAGPEVREAAGQLLARLLHLLDT